MGVVFSTERKDHPSKDGTRPRKCLKCEKEIKPLECAPEGQIPEQGMWDGGMVNLNQAGFGSIYDFDVFLIAVCDDCITKYVDLIEFRENVYWPMSEDTRGINIEEIGDELEKLLRQRGEKD